MDCGSPRWNMLIKNNNWAITSSYVEVNKFQKSQETTNITIFPCDGGKLVMKSIKGSLQICWGIGNDCDNPARALFKFNEAENFARRYNVFDLNLHAWPKEFRSYTMEKFYKPFMCSSVLFIDNKRYQWRIFKQINSILIKDNSVISFSIVEKSKN